MKTSICQRHFEICSQGEKILELQNFKYFFRQVYALEWLGGIVQTVLWYSFAAQWPLVRQSL